MPAIEKEFGSDAWLDQMFANPPARTNVQRPQKIQDEIAEKLAEAKAERDSCDCLICNPALEGLSLSPHGAKHAVHISTAIHQAMPHIRGEVLDALQVLIEALKNEPPQGNCSQQGKEGTAAQ